MVAVELPEKQGLKPAQQARFDIYVKVAVELPEKQGLKRLMLSICRYVFNCCSGTSRKTRIETTNVKPQN